MGNAAGNGLQSRFEKYSEVMIKALGHASREQAARWYLRALMLPGERKSVEPMAARVHPDDVPSAHAPPGGRCPVGGPGPAFCSGR